MTIYQKEHSISNKRFVVEQNRDFSYPEHLHRFYEFIIIIDGEMEVRVGNDVELLHKNECAFIRPNTIHSLESTHSEHILFIFSGELIPNWDRSHKNLISESPFFTIKNDNLTEQIKHITTDSNYYEIKGMLYRICGAYDESTLFLPSKRAKSKTPGSSKLLIEDLLTYIDDNYNEDITLDTLSCAFNYDYTYLSRFIKQETGISFNKYLSQQRVSHACTLLTNTEKSIIEISFACGFNNVRTFNRNFLTIKGVTPTDFRASQN